MDIRAVARNYVGVNKSIDVYDGTEYLFNLWWYDMLPLSRVPGWRAGDGAEFPDVDQEQALQAAVVYYRLTHKE